MVRTRSTGQVDQQKKPTATPVTKTATSKLKVGTNKSTTGATKSESR